MSDHYQFAFLSLIIALMSASPLLSGEPVVQFDVPALLEIREVGFSDGLRSNESLQKTIEIIIPVTAEVVSNDRENIDEFRFDVYWNRNVYPLADYAPKTRTVSGIEGLVSVETTAERKAAIGIDFGTVNQGVVSGSAKADLSNRNGTKLRYLEVPEHDVLVASGTIQRGTGAFFRFHPSKRETLEGGRDLIVAYRVRRSWRGGVIKIECHAKGHRKIVGSWNEPFEESRVFVVPVFLEGDDQARRAAVDFVQSEQGLRQAIRKREIRSDQNILNVFSLSPRLYYTSSLPSQWVDHLIESGRDDYLERYRSKLSGEIVKAADRFAFARQELFRLSR